ncbi:MAG: transcriptional activator NhaR [Planctomycetota bacterium]|nr:MAG: transcriptional activator NhaR [Planctomycetota bacterium]
MDWVNYHHLMYFWTVAREGTIARACEKLHLGQPAISTQLRQLESALGVKLFEKSGRTLELTEIGRTVYRYADEIFSLGGEMLDTIKGRPTGKPIRFAVGIVDSLPKMIAKSLLEPALRMPEPLQLICVEDSLEKLLGELALHNLDLVLSESPVTGAMRIRAFNHQLGESTIGLFGVKVLARKYRPRFPQSLDGAPLLLQRGASPLRRAIDTWLDDENLKPLIRAEFDDSALLKVFGQAGEGLFAAPFVIREEICRQYEVEIIGEIPSIRERYHAISAERRLKHPAVLAISQSAKSYMFG